MLCVFTIFFVIETILAVPFLKDARIANGVLSNGSIPYQVSFKIKGSHFCGGVIYSENIVITAGHCIPPAHIHYNNSEILVGTNKQFDLSEGQLIPVNKMKKHDNYILRKEMDNDVYADYDIALLKLETNLVFNDNVQPIPLATNEPEIGTVGTISGWGNTLDNRNTSENLLVADVKFISRETCQKYTKPAVIANRMLCTMASDDLPSGICEGDSGGPIVVNNELMGLVSFGYHDYNETCTYVSVYTSIPYMRDWIQKEAKDL